MKPQNARWQQQQQQQRKKMLKRMRETTMKSLIFKCVRVVGKREEKIIIDQLIIIT